MVIVAVVAVIAFASPAARAAAPCSGTLTGSGDATYYDYTPGSGACQFNGDDTGALVAAMNTADYAGAAMCGRWLRVTGPLGAVTVRIVDQAPELGVGDIDLNASAFALIADPVSGRVPVTWESVASPVVENVDIVVHESTNPWWTSFQVRHHRYGIAAVEYLAGSGYVNVPRQPYNQFIVDGSLGVDLPVTGPFTVRLTDDHGQQLVVAGLYPNAGQSFATGQQFPDCQDDVAAAPLPATGGARLLPPAPNPFNPRTTVSFTLAARGPATLAVYDVAGRHVATLLDAAELADGRHNVTWDGRDNAGRAVAGGAYVFRLEAGGGVQARTAVLLQ